MTVFGTDVVVAVRCSFSNSPAAVASERELVSGIVLQETASFPAPDYGICQFRWKNSSAKIGLVRDGSDVTSETDDEGRNRSNGGSGPENLSTPDNAPVLGVDAPW